MVGSKLKELKLEISHYIGLPYRLGGKGTWQEIEAQTKKIINSQPSSSRQLYNLLKKNDIGLDCSGLAYHLLFFIDPSIEDVLIGTEGKKGVRRLSANLLTSPPNSQPVTNYDQIQIGDLIRSSQGKHVIFIIEKIKNIIYYVHNSRWTQDRGVHQGTIIITNPSQTLEHQNWSDLQTNGKPYSALFNSSLGDGIFRLAHFSSNNSRYLRGSTD